MPGRKSREMLGSWPANAIEALFIAAKDGVMKKARWDVNWQSQVMVCGEQDGCAIERVIYK